MTVDNASSGHAKKSVDAVAENASRYSNADEYWRRVCNGFRLNNLGTSTTDIIFSFDAEREVLRILKGKMASGAGAHSDYCRIEGKTVNQWLSGDHGCYEFFEALKRKGWFNGGPDPKTSKFWNLLAGDRAEMFGVFSDYELQVICDWLRGPYAVDGWRFDSDFGSGSRKIPLTFRQQNRSQAAASLFKKDTSFKGVSVEIQHLLPTAHLNDIHLLRLVAPSQHWTRSGLEATRQLVDALNFQTIKL